MSLLNLGLIEKYISNNQIKKRDTNGKPFTDIEPVPYRWTHGATDLHLGDGMIVYSVIQMMRAKVCVCLGSGGGFIPRIMTQARIDLHDQKIFTGLKQMEWGDCGTTFVVDADNGVGGFTDWTDKRSFFRKNFDCRVILDTTENAFYNFFVKEDIKIDYLHIDAGHSYDDVKNDFTLYVTTAAESYANGLIEEGYIYFNNYTNELIENFGAIELDDDGNKVYDFMITKRRYIFYLRK